MITNNDDSYEGETAAPPAPDRDATLAFIKHVYHGIRDLSGTPKWEHPYTVMLNLPRHAACDELDIAALLHDVPEDTAAHNYKGRRITIEDLCTKGYTDRTLRTVALVSRIPGVGVYQEGMAYGDWIKAIIATGDRDAIILKYTDVSVNMSPERNQNLPHAERIKRERKYAEPHKDLVAAMEELGLLPRQQLRGYGC